MSTKTTNLQLTKPAYGEAADIAVINTNMDTLDTAVAGKVTAPSSTVTTNTVAVFDGTSGKLIKSSGLTIGKSVPSNAVFTDNDTKNTAGTTNKTGTKLFLAGATSQAANPQTYSNTNVYIGTDNKLYSNGKVVLNADDKTTAVTAGSDKAVTSGAVASAIASSDAFPGQFFNVYSTVIGDVIGVVGYITYMRVSPKKGLLTLNVFIDPNAEAGYNFTSIDKIGSLLGLSFKHPSQTYSTGNWVCAEWSDWGFGQTVNVNPDGSIALARFYIRDQAVSGQWPIGTLGNRHYQIWGIILEEN